MSQHSRQNHLIREKSPYLLHDQALLVKSCLEAYQISKNELYARTARETCDYVLRDMQYAEGGFYSAEDADSFDPHQPAQDPGLSDKDKKEGAFYLLSATRPGDGAIT